MSFNIKPMKPWSVDQFEEYRSHMTSFVRLEVVPLLNHHDTSNVKRLLIHGQVKVGKREIVEYIAVRDSINQMRVHVFISSFHRKADDSQRDELELHGIHVYSIHSARRRAAAIKFIGDQLGFSPHMFVVIHWDECDYGTGDSQNLAELHKMFRDHPRIFNIYYSATPEEMLYSNEIARNRDPEDSIISDFYEDGVVLKYKPPVGYCGAQEFLDNNLVFQVLPFFDCHGNTIRLSDQAKEIIADARAEMKATNRRRRRMQDALDDAEDAGDLVRVETIKAEMAQLPVRNIISLRLSYFLNDDDDDESEDDASVASSNKACKAIYAFLKCSQYVDELKDVEIRADKPDVKELDVLPNVTTEVVQWSKKCYWDGIPTNKVVIFVNDQTSTRSTEWVCHDRIFATHDYRKRLTFNTVAQAQLRPAHYKQNYGGFQPIRIYGDLKTFRFAVGQISAVEYLNSEWYVRKIPKSDPPMFRIKNDVDAKRPMPAIKVDGITYEGLPNKAGYSAEIVQRMLVQLGGTNNGSSKMSQRVRGNSKLVPVIKAQFYPCDPAQKYKTLDIINEDPEFEDLLNGHTFTGAGLFAHQDPETQLYKGYLRGRKVLEYDQMENELWGIRIGQEHARLTECYRNGELGLCLRVATGERREVNDLSVYKSMYQGNSSV